MLRLFRNNQLIPPLLFRHPNTRLLNFFFIVSALVFLLGLGFLTLFEIRIVHGRSMEPQYPEGTLVLINRWAYGPRLPILNDYFFFWNTPKQGEIIAFYHPTHFRESIKLVLGAPGDLLPIEDKYLVYQNIKIPLKSYQYIGLERQHRVPPERVFVVGTNWEMSTDSRDYGSFPLVFITGQVLFSLR